MKDLINELKMGKYQFFQITIFFRLDSSREFYVIHQINFNTIFFHVIKKDSQNVFFPACRNLHDTATRLRDTYLRITLETIFQGHASASDDIQPPRVLLGGAQDGQREWVQGDGAPAQPARILTQTSARGAASLPQGALLPLFPQPHEQREHRDRFWANAYEIS